LDAAAIGPTGKGAVHGREQVQSKFPRNRSDVQRSRRFGKSYSCDYCIVLRRSVVTNARSIDARRLRHCRRDGPFVAVSPALTRAVCGSRTTTSVADQFVETLAIAGAERIYGMVCVTRMRAKLTRSTSPITATSSPLMTSGTSRCPSAASSFRQRDFELSIGPARSGAPNTNQTPRATTAAPCT
jgi:hypothetical protein